MIMMSDKAWKIAQRNGGIWGLHSKHLRYDWVNEVTTGLTQIGYWDWVVAKVKEEVTDESINDTK